MFFWSRSKCQTSHFLIFRKLKRVCFLHRCFFCLFSAVVFCVCFLRPLSWLFLRLFFALVFSVCLFFAVVFCTWKKNKNTKKTVVFSVLIFSVRLFFLLPCFSRACFFCTYFFCTGLFFLYACFLPLFSALEKK